MTSMLDVKCIGSGFEGHFELPLICFVEIYVNSTKSSKYDNNLILWLYAQKNSLFFILHIMTAGPNIFICAGHI